MNNYTNWVQTHTARMCNRKPSGLCAQLPPMSSVYSTYSKSLLLGKMFLRRTVSAFKIRLHLCYLKQIPKTKLSYIGVIFPMDIAPESLRWKSNNKNNSTSSTFLLKIIRISFDDTWRQAIFTLFLITNT